jgi:hypothetical protein
LLGLDFVRGRRGEGRKRRLGRQPQPSARLGQRHRRHPAFLLHHQLHGRDAGLNDQPVDQPAGAGRNARLDAAQHGIEPGNLRLQ